MGLKPPSPESVKLWRMYQEYCDQPRTTNNRSRNPYFSCLALSAILKEDDSIHTAATDGRHIIVNREYIEKLSFKEVVFLFTHELLHMMLLHVIRLNGRDPKIWNVAADAIINEMIKKGDAGFTSDEVSVIEGGVDLPHLYEFSTEEAYLALYPDSDLLLQMYGGECDDLKTPGEDGDGKQGYSEAELAELEKIWQATMKESASFARQYGTLPAGIERILVEVEKPTKNWKEELARFFSKASADWTTFDRRFIADGDYIDATDGTSIKLFVAIDTSGSINDALLKLFYNEVSGFIQSADETEVHIYFFDCGLYFGGIMNHTSLENEFPKPVGGGGTSFEQMYKFIAENKEENFAAMIILTDGYGSFPAEQADIETLWVVTPGGLPATSFPFGHVVNITE